MCTCRITILILLTGVEVTLPRGLKEIVKGTILLSADDLPAKAVISCMKQFNERYGCQLCLQEVEPSVMLRKIEMIIANAEEELN